MTNVLTGVMAVLLAAVAIPANAQWLKHPTPNIPRTADGKPNLAAPAPRGADGHPDLSGPWTGRLAVIRVPDEALTAESKALIREREENYFKDRPAFQCQPTGPETVAGWRRIIQTPSLIAIAYETLTYRLIFMDGRQLEANPERTWMGYSVGRWEGDTLVVDSFGFNDRTWLDARGLPAHGSTPDDRTLPAAHVRTVTGRAHRHRSRRLRQVVDSDVRPAVPAGLRDGRRRVRRQDPLDRPFVRR